MLKGNACHMNLWDVMGNKTHDMGGHVRIAVGERIAWIPRSWYTKAGKVKKAYKAKLAETLLMLRREPARVAA